jgi:hypothetical protein
MARKERKQHPNKGKKKTGNRKTRIYKVENKKRRKPHDSRNISMLRAADTQRTIIDYGAVDRGFFLPGEMIEGLTVMMMMMMIIHILKKVG